MSAKLKFGSYCLKRSGRVLAKSVGFELPAGRYLEMRGENGVGKTSLLRVLAGLSDDHDQLANISNTSVFYFAHQAGFRPELTVIKQFSLSLQMLGIDVRNEELLQELERVGLRKAKFAQVRTLSHGQWRRLAMAVMVLSQRQLWLIDEPLNALDAQAKTLFAELLSAHLEAGGMAIIATHQSIAEALPTLKQYCEGDLSLAAASASFVKQQNNNSLYFSQRFKSIVKPLNAQQSFAWGMRRELALLTAKPLDILWPALFFAMVVSMFPLAIGANTQILQIIAAGVFWMSALLSVLMAAQRFYSADDETGALVQIRSAKLSLTAFCAAKIVANSLFLALPILLLTYLLGLLYHLPLQIIYQTALSIMLGLFSLTALSALFSSLSLMARQAQVMMSLLAFPVFVPLLIFGTAAANKQSEHLLSAPMIVMISLAVLFILTMPFVTAKALKLAIE